jgi:hypothetical protein
MVALGPRVGGAHVDVNMRFDDNSLKQVGKDIKRQLTSLTKQLEKVGQQNTKVYRGIGQNAVTAWRAAVGAAITGAPLIGGAISGITGVATELAGALYSVGQESGALLPIFTSLGVAGLTLKIGMRNFAAAVSEVDPKKLELLLKGMPKSMQDAVMATRKLSNEMRAAVWPVLFKGLSDGIENLRNTGVIQRGLGLMAESLNGLAKSVLRYANSAEGTKTLNKFFKNNADVFAALSKIAVPFLDGFLRLTNALTPSAIRLAGAIQKVAEQFQEWTKGEGFNKRIDTAMKGAAKTAGKLWEILGNLTSALTNVFNAANPSTNNFLDMIIDITQRFQDWTESVGGQNTIAKWADAANEMMKQVGHTIEAIWPVMVKLSDPRVMGSFLKTVEGAFKLLNKLPLEAMVNAFLKVSDALQPISSFFLAFIIAGVAVNIMIGSLIGQMGGFVSIIAKIIRFKILTNILKNMGGPAGEATKKVGLLRRAWELILKVFEKVKGAVSKVLGFFGKTNAATGETSSKVGRLVSAFKPMTGVLTKIAKFAGWAGFVVWIVILIAKSKALQAKLGELWDSIKGVFSSLGGAFSEIGTALKPLAPVAKGVGKALGFVFDIIDKIATLAIGVVLDMMIYGFKSLGLVIEGLGHIIAGLITFLIALFTLDWGMMWKGIKQMASGVWPLLKGLFGLFITFFAPAKFLKLGLFALKGLGAGMKAAMPAILKGLGRFLVFIGKGFLELVPKLAKLGGEAIVALGKAVVKYAPVVLRAAGRLVVGFLKWYISLPGKLLSLGVRAIKFLGNAVIKGTPKILAAAGRIVAGVINWIVKLPGRLSTLGQQSVSKLGSAISRGIGALKRIASDVVTSVVNIIKGLPGKLLGLGGELLSAGKTLGGKILEGIRSGISAIGDMAGSIASSLKTGINNAIGLPKSLSFKVLGKSIGFTIPGFEKGGIVPGGMALVGEGGPELVNLARGSRVHSNADSKKMMGNGLPKRVILRIGSRDFEAYVEELADNRISASDSLAWQGA